MLRNPSAVVRLARNTGCRLSRRASTMASCLESPARMRCCKATSMCTQLATTIISTMVGAGAMGGEKGSPAQPPRPMDATMEKIMTAPVAATPDRPRVSTPSTRAMSRRLVGRKIIWLSMEASRKVWLTITVPTMRRSMPSNRCSACARDGSGEFGDLGHRGHLVPLGHFDGNVHDADVAVQGHHAAADAWIGQGDGPDLRPRFGIVEYQRIDQVPHEEVVAVGGCVLKIGDRIDTPRIRRLPGLFGQPDGSGKRGLRCGVTVVRNDEEDDVLVLSVGVLQLFQCQKLRVVFIEEDAVVGGEIEQRDAGGGGRNPGQRSQDDQPAALEHALGETPGELPGC